MGPKNKGNLPPGIQNTQTKLVQGKPKNIHTELVPKTTQTAKDSANEAKDSANETPVENSINRKPIWRTGKTKETETNKRVPEKDKGSTTKKLTGTDDTYSRNSRKTRKLIKRTGKGRGETKNSKSPNTNSVAKAILKVSWTGSSNTEYSRMGNHSKRNTMEKQSANTKGHNETSVNRCTGPDRNKAI